MINRIAGSHAPRQAKRQAAQDDKLKCLKFREIGKMPLPDPVQALHAYEMKRKQQAGEQIRVDQRHQPTAPMNRLQAKKTERPARGSSRASIMKGIGSSNPSMELPCRLTQTSTTSSNAQAGAVRFARAVTRAPTTAPGMAKRSDVDGQASTGLHSTMPKPGPCTHKHPAGTAEDGATARPRSVRSPSPPTP